MGIRIFGCKRIVIGYNPKRGVATAHGTNFVDLRGESWDETTAFWLSVLTTNEGASVLQRSSTNYQKEWQSANPTPWIFHRTKKPIGRTVSNKTEDAGTLTWRLYRHHSAFDWNAFWRCKKISEANDPRRTLCYGTLRIVN